MEFRELLKEYRDIGLLKDPEFKKSRRKHDWRNYIPEKVQEHWRLLTSETKVMLYLTAQDIANKETWD